MACRAAKRNRVSGLIIALLLAGSSGTFLASTTLLPSTFAMYCMTAATTGILNGSVEV